MLKRAVFDAVFFDMPKIIWYKSIDIDPGNPYMMHPQEIEIIFEKVIVDIFDCYDWNYGKLLFIELEDPLRNLLLMNSRTKSYVKVL